MRDRTLWSNEEAKWKPRNFQAVKITFPAKGYHLPPPEPTINVLEQRKAEAEQKRKRAEQAAAELEAHYKAQKERQDREREEQRRLKKIKAGNPKHRWLAKAIKEKAKKSGKPTPTTGEINAAISKFASGHYL